MSRNARSPQATDYRRYYKTAAWEKTRRFQLANNPLCKFCLAAGLVVPATVVDHIKPHKGNWFLFTSPANLQSLCSKCHASAKQSAERTGQPVMITGRDGWPIEISH